ncbi:quinone oxidoreductase family protein [Cupriavidus pauculus]|uniref:Alcohol dehydrogenase n=1 Tax=Cupriavidus pauculus TaxID=82633 RepID=A0A2N5CDJ7_9BURK|nr:quinone oxidoreductase [Cupriavidus pauculus]PLQ00286.1 alcohol dehydrogenase [Cupriavidus pauculus]
MKAVVMKDVGDVDVLAYVDRQDPNPGPGEVLVSVAAAGVNFMDIGVRQGMAWTGVSNPKILGVEGAGCVLAVGDGVSDFAVGDRVAWVYAPGSYAEMITMPAEALVPLPDDIDFCTAASLMMNGLTASHFATEFYPVQEGDIALVHAAAGGVGSLLTQIIKLRGGRVIGRVSSEAKRRVAVEAGVDDLLIDNKGSFLSAVMRLTNGEGVHVVYDGSGPASFQASLNSLRHAGTFCWFGPVLEASRAIELFSLPKSIKIGFAVFSDHIRTPEQLRERSAQLFNWVRQGKLKVFNGGEYALADAARAHADMWSRQTSGKLLLVP